MVGFEDKRNGAELQVEDSPAERHPEGEEEDHWLREE